MQTNLKRDGIGKGETEFAFHLLQKVSTKAPTNNVFLSPFSASQAVLLAANGTTGATQQGFLNAIGLSASTLSDVNPEKKALLTLLNPPMEDMNGKQVPLYEWTAANAIWSRYSPKPFFVEIGANYYGANAQPLTTAAAINTWASEKTRGRIPQIVNDGTVRGADLILTNAVYFKGRWVKTFEAHATEDAPFHLPNSPARTQPFMHRTSRDILWYKGKNYEAVSLPYRGGVSMLVLLPTQKTGAPDVLKSLSAEGWSAMRTGLKPSWIALALPKFELEYETGLLPPLKELGMPTEGDFSTIADQLTKTKITDVIQKTFLRVDEQGTEAAAVTAVVAVGSAMMPRPVGQPHPFVVDRPFLCAIVQDDTGVILFNGIINDPKPAK